MNLREQEIDALELNADYHTHTVFSHGKGTIEDNVKAAIEKGLKTIGICDHGFRHMMYAITPQKLQVMRIEVERLRKIYPIEILLGVEANLLNLDGELDVTEKEAEELDILIFGAHQTSKPHKLRQFFNFNFRNLFPQGKKRKEKNTAAYIKAIRRYKPKIVVHPNYVAKVNCGELARAAAECGTLLELNGKRTLFTKQDVQDMLQTDVQFVINSDAHSADRVGEFQHVKDFLKQNPIPLERIVNLKKKITEK